MDLYWRIHSGINGAQMPASNNAVKTPKEIWELVNFVLTVSESKGRRQLKEKFQIDVDQ